MAFPRAIRFDSIRAIRACPGAGLRLPICPCQRLPAPASAGAGACLRLPQNQNVDQSGDALRRGRGLLSSAFRPSSPHLLPLLPRRSSLRVCGQQRAAQQGPNPARTRHARRVRCELWRKSKSVGPTVIIRYLYCTLAPGKKNGNLGFCMILHALFVWPV